MISEDEFDNLIPPDISDAEWARIQSFSSPPTQFATSVPLTIPAVEDIEDLATEPTKLKELSSSYGSAISLTESDLIVLDELDGVETNLTIVSTESTSTSTPQSSTAEAARPPMRSLFQLYRRASRFSVTDLVDLAWFAIPAFNPSPKLTQVTLNVY